MAYAIETVIDGSIYGAVYALMALGFVVTFKTLRVANFALGEFILFGAGCAALATARVASVLPPSAMITRSTAPASASSVDCSDSAAFSVGITAVSSPCVLITARSRLREH